MPKFVSPKGNIVESTDPVTINNLLYGHGYRRVEDVPAPTEPKAETKPTAKPKTVDQGSDTTTK